MIPILCEICLISVHLAVPDAAPEPGAHGHFLALTGKTNTPPPFADVDLYYGPREKISTPAGEEEALWWQLEARPEAKEGEPRPAAPLFRLRALTSRDPLADEAEPIRFHRYLLRLEAAGEAFEYRNVHTGAALLPAWNDFERLFVPRRARACGAQRGVAETAAYLGHVLSLQYAGYNVPWEKWDGVPALDLDPELLVGTGRNFKDAEGGRLPQKPQRQEYKYIPFVEADYPVMIDAGINLFIVDGQQTPWVRGRPVFFIRGFGGSPPLSYPADLYRSNYLGPVMFLDEPGIIMVGDKNIHRTLRYFSDAAAVLEKRVRESYFSDGGYGMFQLERQLASAGANLGDMRIAQPDFPAWETLFETAFYQLEAGLPGLVHEGRYRLEPFDQAVARITGRERKHTAAQLLRWHYAILRGAARAFGKSWGTSIYGQCDPKIAPEAVTLAYDLGARYLWFWTSDHDHHLPWPEQLELARLVKKRAGERKRPSLAGAPPVLEKAIAIPYGYFISLENLWWVRVLDPAGQNEAAEKYGRLLRRVLDEVEDCFDKGEDFDIAVDDGREIKGYRRVVRVVIGE
ncbi:MAG: hypothetical protein HY717_12525 [Planctomycetes bacterium]|nr:hypothetical protein [Planctomycetota bacterium]